MPGVAIEQSYGLRDNFNLLLIHAQAMRAARAEQALVGFTDHHNQLQRRYLESTVSRGFSGKRAKVVMGP